MHRDGLEEAESRDSTTIGKEKNAHTRAETKKNGNKKRVGNSVACGVRLPPSPSLSLSASFFACASLPFFFSA